MQSSFTSKNLLILLIVVGAAITISESQQIKKRPPPSLSNDEKCRRFSIVNKSNNSFTSPLYPNNYPPHTKCVLTIKAEHGYLIRIDWRDSFIMESSDADDKQKCDNDYLEIRDGPHWYSDVIGKYCGRDFPPMITSKDRYLFLLFSSDDTLEYTGFEAVYSFIQNTQIVRPEIEQCYFVKSGAQGFLSHIDVPDLILNYSTIYSVHIDCVWFIEVKLHEKIYLFFDTFELAKANECEINYIEIFWGDPDIWQKKNKFCGSTADPVVTQGNKMYFRYFDVNVRNASKHTKFEAWFTAYRDRITDGDSKNSRGCNEDEFDCDDATCIDLSLKCNNVTNCRLRYDEEGCNTRNIKKFDITSEHIIIILTLGLGLLAGMFCAACFRCIKKLIKDGKQIQENIRRSREQLEEKRSASVSSSHKLLNRSHLVVDAEAAYVDGKRNGQTRIQADENSEPDGEDEEEEEEEEEEGEEEEEEEEEDEDEEDEDDEEGEDSCVEMRDCECQTRDSLVSQRESPPPPPPPIRRPPDVPPPISPHLRIQPTAPPLPGANPSYLNRLPRKKDPTYSSPPQSSDNYEVNDISSAPKRQKHKAEAHIQMKDRPKSEVKKVPKGSPDVLAIH